MDRILWTQDRDYVWHAGKDFWPKTQTLCGSIEPSGGGVFNYPKYQLDLSNLCAECNQESGANYR
jgi:hypothetical protein